MMAKKDYILKVLDALMGHRPLARGLKILIEGNGLNDKTIDSFVDIFSKTIDGVVNAEVQEKLKKSKDALEKIKQIEREQHLNDKESLKDLDAMISAI